MLEYREFPVEQLLRHRRERLQSRFAIEAAQYIAKSDEGTALPSADGLHICAVNEEALSWRVESLAKVYGDDLRVGEPRVRYALDGELCEPHMHVRMHVRQRAVGTVLRELHHRDARILEHSPVERIGGTPLMSVIRLVTPLARVIGLQKRLDQVTDGDAVAEIALSHYEVVPVAQVG